MPKLPYFNFYPDDYLSSPGVTTSDLADEGIYIRLLSYSWKHDGCQLPEDIEYLKRLVGKGVREDRLKRVLDKFFIRIELEKGKFYRRNLRLFTEFCKVHGIKIKRSEAAKVRWNKEKQNAKAPDLHMQSYMQNDAIPDTRSQIPYPEESLEAGSFHEPHGEVPTTTAKKSSRRRPGKRKSEMTDEEWLAMVKANPAYTGLDVDLVQAKLIAWCATKGKKPTRSRLLNWLNREEKPMGGGSSAKSFADRKQDETEHKYAGVRSKFAPMAGGNDGKIADIERDRILDGEAFELSEVETGQDGGLHRTT